MTTQPRSDDPRPFRDLIARHDPDLSIERIEPLPHVGWGGDSHAWLVNGALVFRFPRSLDIARQLHAETLLLPGLSAHLPLSIPDFRYIAADPAPGTPLFVGYPTIQGEPMTPDLLDALAIPDDERAELAAALGSFLAGLHNAPIDQARVAGVSELREPERTRQLYDRARDTVYPLLSRAMRAWTDHLFDDYLANPGLWAFEPALTHGDLSADHILFDRASRKIAGIIDFGDMALYDPMADFVGLREYGEGFIATALAAYARPLSHTASERLRFYQRRTPFIALAWGAEHGDEAAVSDGISALRAVIAGDTSPRA
jgi:aminoglycoside 2''-phosphotransferase